MLPSSVTIRSTETNVTGRIAGCNGPYYANAALNAPNDTTSDTETIFDDSPVGTYHSQVDGTSYDRDFTVIGIHNDSTYVRFGTRSRP